MANLASNKLPLEKENWIKPEIATNGDVLNYDGHNGFASAKWPCTYTIDLVKSIRINTIRFLLWDGLGWPLNKLNDRKYKFTLQVSEDGNSFYTIFSNQYDEIGLNGWVSFKFLVDTYIRFVRLIGHYNTANQEFHIVEFEIHDSNPSKLKSNNFRNFDIITGIPNENRIRNIIDEILLSKGEIFTGYEDKIKSLDNALKQWNSVMSSSELIKKSIDYGKESDGNNKRAKRWLYASIATIILFFVCLFVMIYCDDHSKKIIEDASQNKATLPYIKFLLSSFYVSKALLFSTILFLLGWFLKNYRSEKHNYTVNKHKAMTLTVAISILTNEDFKGIDRSDVFVQAMKIIFTHQSTGFSKEESENPSMINTILTKGIEKPSV